MYKEEKEDAEKNLKENKLRVDIFADGGITQVCDVPKSLVMGAKMVMIGGMFTGFKESPGRIVTGSDGKIYQEFYGSASEFSKANDGNKKTKNIEGTIKLVPYKNKSVFNFLSELKQALQSSISYGGGTNLSCLKNVKFILKK
jgi:GMP reductase